MKFQQLWCLLPLALLIAEPAWSDPVRIDTTIEFGEIGGFAAEHGWDLAQTSDVLRLTAPEGDFHLAVVNVGEADDAKAAATMAIVRAGAKARNLETSSATAALDGWDEKVLLTYLVPPAEHGKLQVFALRRGKHWTALVLQGSLATEEKRIGSINSMVTTVRPKGYQSEDFSGRSANLLTPERIQALTDFLSQSMQKLQVPGVGLALIQNNKVIWEGGLGVRRLGDPTPVDAHTRFMIGSVTKGMSTLLLSSLVDEGKLGWDQPVTKIYSPFRLGSEATTQTVLVRHLVCACTGLPRKDMEWIFNGTGKPASDTMAQLAITEPTSKFGEVFQYNNLMAAAAGYIGGHIAHPSLELGAAYDRAMQERIFDPLGMKDTTFATSLALEGNHAEPSTLDLNGRATVPPQTVNMQIYPYRPAGGAWSSTHDVARYVMLELGEGMLDGKRIISSANLLERRRRNVPMSNDTWYGMGLQTQSRNGIDVVSHRGRLLGYLSQWFALPEAGVGAVVLTNSMEGARLLDPFLRRMMEVLWDAKPQASELVAKAVVTQQAELAAQRARLTFGEEVIARLGLATNYHNPMLGRLEIVQRNGLSRIKPGPYDNPFAVQHNEDGTDSLVLTGPDLLGVSFLVGKVGDKRTLTLRDGQHAYVYIEE